MREWTIKAYQFSNGIESVCDGPIPEVNEIVPVVEKKHYDRLKSEIAKLGGILTAMGAGPNILKVVDDALTDR